MKSKSSLLCEKKSSWMENSDSGCLGSNPGSSHEAMKCWGDSGKAEAPRVLVMPLSALTAPPRPLLLALGPTSQPATLVSRPWKCHTLSSPRGVALVAPSSWNVLPQNSRALFRLLSPSKWAPPPCLVMPRFTYLCQLLTYFINNQCIMVIACSFLC